MVETIVGNSSLLHYKVNQLLNYFDYIVVSTLFKLFQRTPFLISAGQDDVNKKSRVDTGADSVVGVTILLIV